MIVAWYRKVVKDSQDVLSCASRLYIFIKVWDEADFGTELLRNMPMTYSTLELLRMHRIDGQAYRLPEDWHLNNCLYWSLINPRGTYTRLKIQVHSRPVHTTVGFLKRKPRQGITYTYSGSTAPAGCCSRKADLRWSCGNVGFGGYVGIVRCSFLKCLQNVWSQRIKCVVIDRVCRNW
jgi:hypothetical protein